RAIGKTHESVVTISDARGQRLAAYSMTSPGGEHGWSVVKAAWTPDSRYFVFSAESSGGHQPWHFPTYAFSRRGRRVYAAEDGLVNSTTTPLFRLTAPHTLWTRCLGQGNAQRLNLARLEGPRPLRNRPTR